LPACPPARTMAAGASSYAYNTTTLNFYDHFVLGLTNSFGWRCPTDSVLLPLFQANAGPRHMDVGVGSGYFPTAMHQREGHSGWPKKLVLVDLNPICLEQVSSRVGLPERIMCLENDALQPLPDVGPFDSISLMYLLHCLPGPPENKARIFANLKPHLADDGVLFGATILGQGVRHNWFGQILMSAYNWFGIFGNSEDGKEHFLQALEAEFEEVETAIIGCVFIFKARKPRRE
jgi:SAM-dependent methyltransferase